MTKHLPAMATFVLLGMLTLGMLGGVSLSYFFVGFVVLLLAVLLYAYPYLTIPVVLSALFVHPILGDVVGDVVSGERFSVGYFEPIILAGTFLFLLIKKFPVLVRNPRRLLPGTLPGTIVLFIVFCFVRTIFTADWGLSMAGFAVLCGYCAMFFVFIWSVERPSLVSGILRFYLAAAAALALGGWVEFLFDMDFSSFGGPAVFEGSQGPFQPVSSLIGNRLALGSILAVAISIAMARFIGEKSRKTRLFLGGLIILCLSTEILTFARSSWLATAVATSWLLFTWRKQLRLGRFLTPAILAGVALAGTLPFLSPELFPERLAATFAVSSDPVQMSRMERWQLGFQKAIETPSSLFFGHGPGTVGPATYRSLRLQLGLTTAWEVGRFINRYVLETESWILHLMNEVGVVGLSLFLLIGFAAVQHWRRMSPQAPRELFPSLSGCVAAIIGLLFSNIFLPTLNHWAVAAVFWTLLAVVHTGCRLHDPSTSAPVLQWKRTQPIPPVLQPRRVIAWQRNCCSNLPDPVRHKNGEG